jgi:hypothetical protein
MQVPINNIIEAIKKEKDLSEDEINAKIASKMEELAGLVSEEGAAHIVANELGVKIFNNEPQDVKVENIRPFMKNLQLTAKVVQKFDVINFERNSNPGKVQTCVIGDETGTIRASFWHAATDALESIEVGDVIGLKSVVSKDNNGRADLSVANAEQVEKKEGVTIEVLNKSPEPPVKKIADLGEDTSATILGVAVQAFKPSFYYSCPECNKRVKGEEGFEQCDVHGKVVSNLSYVCNTFIDDGSNSLRCVFFNAQAEKLAGLTNEDFKVVKAEEKDIKEKIVGKIVKVSGAIRYNSFSQQNELVVNSVVTDIDPSSL